MSVLAMTMRNVNDARAASTYLAERGFGSLSHVNRLFSGNLHPDDAFFNGNLFLSVDSLAINRIGTFDNVTDVAGNVMQPVSGGSYA